jgi:hypothetical protein
VDLSNRDAEFAQRLAYRLCKGATVVVELALLADVLRIEWVWVGLILIGCIVAENDDKAAVVCVG